MALKTIELTLRDGTMAAFRETTAGDMEAVADAIAGGATQTSAGLQQLQRQCLQWGDRPGISRATLDKVPTRDIQRVSKALQKFIPTDKEGNYTGPFDVIENEDYSLSLALPSDGLEITLGDAVGRDLDWIERQSGTDFGKMLKLVERLAIAWGTKRRETGDRTAENRVITLDELRQRPARDGLALSKLASMFL